MQVHNITDTCRDKVIDSACQNAHLKKFRIIKNNCKGFGWRALGKNLNVTQGLLVM